MLRILLFLVGSWLVLGGLPAGAALMQPTTVYLSTCGTGAQTFGSIGAAVAACAALSQGSPCTSDPYAPDGFAKYQIESISSSPSGFYGNCPKADGTGYWIAQHTWTYVYVYASGSGCPQGFTLYRGMCTDAIAPGGSPQPKGTATIDVAVPYAPNPTSPPQKICVDGVGYTPQSGNNQCALDGVQQWCLSATNDGTTCTAGSGGYVGAVTASNGLPVQADTTCSGNEIVNTSTGVSTCMGASATQPIKTVSTTVDPTTGNVSQSVAINNGSGNTSGGQTQVTTPGGVTTTVAGGAAAGGSSGSGGGGGSTSVTNFPSDYARAGEAASAASSINSALGGKLDTANSKLGDIKSALSDASATAPTDPTVRPSSDISDLMPDSTFSGLKTWTLPGRTVSCPAPSFTLWSHTYTIDGHCTLWASVGSSAAAIMLLVWTIGAMLIVLGA